MGTSGTMPFIPEFSDANTRNKWIVDNATYFTIIRRKNRQYLREERPTFEEAEACAKKLLERDPHGRFLIYGVYEAIDALAATVSVDGTKKHV